MIDAAQRRLYRRALGLAPPGVARLKGLEIMDNKEPQDLVNVKDWSMRVKLARVRLLREVQYAHPGEPIRTVVFDGQGNPRNWPGTNIPGNTVTPRRAVPGCALLSATRLKYYRSKHSSIVASRFGGGDRVVPTSSIFYYLFTNCFKII